MNKPHKHRDIIIAYAEGADVQYKFQGAWEDWKTPCFKDDLEYRIKPKIVKKEGWVNIHIASVGPVILSGIFSTEKDAKKYAGLTTVNKIITVRIEWEEEQ